MLVRWKNGMLYVGPDIMRRRAWHVLLCWNHVGLTPPFRAPKIGEKVFHNELEFGWPPLRRQY